MTELYLYRKRGVRCFSLPCNLTTTFVLGQNHDYVRIIRYWKFWHVNQIGLDGNLKPV